MKNRYWLLLHCCLVMLSTTMVGSVESASSSTQEEVVPPAMVDLYTSLLSKYLKKFVEVGCLKVIRESGLDCLVKQATKDIVCLGTKKQCKSDVFVRIGKCCQSLDNMYVSHPFFKNRYTDADRYSVLQKLLEDPRFNKASLLLDNHEAERKALTVNYDQQDLSCAPETSFLLWLYRGCELLRFGKLATDALAVSSNLERLRLSLRKYQNHSVLREYVTCIQENYQGVFYPNLYWMAVAIVAPQTKNDWKTKNELRKDIETIADYYLMLQDSVDKQCMADVNYQNFVEEIFLKFVNKRAFVGAVCTLQSIGGYTNRCFLKHFLDQNYSQWVQKTFDNEVGMALREEYEKKFQELYHCYSKLMVAKQQKLQLDANVWVDGVSELEKQRDDFEKRVQTSFDMMQLEKQHTSDVVSVGAGYLEQKNNQLLQQPSMKKWMDLVGLRRLARQQQLEHFQRQKEAWQVMQQQLEEERLGHELDVVIDVVGKASSIVSERSIW